MIADATPVSVFIGEGVMSDGVLAFDALMDALARRLVPAATLLRGIEGFDLHRRIQPERLPEILTDLPLLAVAVAAQNNAARVVEILRDAAARCVAVLARARGLVHGGHAANSIRDELRLGWS